MMPRMLLVLMFGLLALAGMAAPSSAALVCGVTVSDAAFGSISARDAGADQTTGTATLDCSGATADVTVYACLNLGAGSGGSAGIDNTPRYLRRADNTTLDYLLMSGGYSGAVWNSGTPFAALTLSEADPAGVISEPLYGQIASSGADVKGGDYASAFTGSDAAWTYGTFPDCSSPLDSGTTSFNVTASVVPSCTVVANPLAFGTIEFGSGPIDQATSIDVTCTPETSYTVSLGLGGGEGVTDPAFRKMTNGAMRESFYYGLYQDSGHSFVWGADIGENTVAGTGTGASQSLPVYGRIQMLDPVLAGTYTDSVVVTITY